jgi:hypothetical protein
VRLRALSQSLAKRCVETRGCAHLDCCYHAGQGLNPTFRTLGVRDCIV